GERRAQLEQLLEQATPPVYLTPATRDPDLAADWFRRFEGAGFDGVVAKPIRDPYTPGGRTMLKVKHERTCDCVVAGYRLHKDGKGVGSLLLGLYDGEGVLHHVGVASSMAAGPRAEMLATLQTYREHALDGHPWRDWAEAAAGAVEGEGRMPGG